MKAFESARSLELIKLNEPNVAQDQLLLRNDLDFVTLIKKLKQAYFWTSFVQLVGESTDLHL
jgi:hypothetical protein